MNVSIFSKEDYENISDWTIGQNKPNSNPIKACPERSRMGQFPKVQNEQWFKAKVNFPDTIMVPFPWDSKLSGIEDKADIGWYSRSLTIPKSWQRKRVFLMIGACDWHTTAWLDGNLLGDYQGGYTSFEFDITPHLKNGKTHRLVLRVDDTPHKFKLEGKQGYGRAAGIWQTVYLEARPQVALETVHFTPDIDNKKVIVEATLDKAAPEDMKLQLQFKSYDLANPNIIHTVQKGAREIQFDVAIRKPRLWSLEDPYLYEVEVMLLGPDEIEDRLTRKLDPTRLVEDNSPCNNDHVATDINSWHAYRWLGAVTW